MRKIHDWYLLKQFTRVFLFSVLAFSVIYVTVDVFEEIDNFLDHDASFPTIVLYYLHSLPFILTYIAPVSLLLATIFSMGIMARRNEITAFIASGLSLVRISLPILIAAIIASIGLAAFNELIVTKANRIKEDIKRYDIEGRTRTSPYLKENFHYLGEKGYLYLARRYNHHSRTLFDVVIQMCRIVPGPAMSQS